MLFVLLSISSLLNLLLHNNNYYKVLRRVYMKKYLICFLLSLFVIFITGCSQVNREESTTTPIDRYIGA